MRKLAENPTLQLKTHDKSKYETEAVRVALAKIVGLMQLGFGGAGHEIISANLANSEGQVRLNEHEPRRDHGGITRRSRRIDGSSSRLNRGVAVAGSRSDAQGEEVRVRVRILRHPTVHRHC